MEKGTKRETFYILHFVNLLFLKSRIAKIQRKMAQSASSNKISYPCPLCIECFTILLFFGFFFFQLVCFNLIFYSIYFPSWLFVNNKSINIANDILLLFVYINAMCMHRTCTKYEIDVIQWQNNRRSAQTTHNQQRECIQIR